MKLIGQNGIPVVGSDVEVDGSVMDVDGVGVGVGVGPDCAQYWPPVFVSVLE